MKKSNLITAAIVLNLWVETQTNPMKNWSASVERWSDSQPSAGKTEVKMLGIIAGIIGAATLYARMFPTAPESERITIRERALNEVEKTIKQLRILGDSSTLIDNTNTGKNDSLALYKKFVKVPANSLTKADIAFVKSEDTTNSEELNITNEESLLSKMIKTLEGTEKEIMKNIENDTEKLKRRNESKSKRTWKEWWQGTHNK